MDRLTHKARYEAGYKLNKDVREWQAVDRLAAYENTGITRSEEHTTGFRYRNGCQNARRQLR